MFPIFATNLFDLRDGGPLGESSGRVRGVFKFGVVL